VRHLENFISNPAVHASLHWSNKIYGSDLMFRDRVRYLEKNLNFNVYEYDTPPEYDPHNLMGWLIEKKQQVPMMMDAVRNEFIALGHTVHQTQPDMIVNKDSIIANSDDVILQSIDIDPLI
jgi:hypothetical protein